MSGRKTAIVTIPDGMPGPSQRDRGKMYRLEEWPAARAERWGEKMLIALARSNSELKMSLSGIGMEGIAILGINALLTGGINGDEVLPLWDELLECVQIIRDPKHPEIAQAIVSDDDIEEVATRVHLRSEVLRLHTNFSPADALSEIWRSITTKTEQVLQTT